MYTPRYSTLDPDSTEDVKSSMSGQDNKSFVNDQENNSNDKHLESVELRDVLEDNKPSRVSVVNMKSDVNESNGPQMEDESTLSKFILKIEHRSKRFIDSHKSQLQLFFKLLLFISYNVYFAFALYYNWEKSYSYCDGVKFLTILTIIGYVFLIYNKIITRYVIPSWTEKAWLPMTRYFNEIHSKYVAFRVLLYVVPIVGIIVFVIVELGSDISSNRSMSFLGIIVFIFFGIVFSKNPRKIRFRIVVWGMILQFLFGLMTLKWSVGRSIFQCLGEKVSYFLGMTDAGSKFVFGYLVDGILKQPKDFEIPKQAGLFAFKIMPIVIYFSFFTSMLYHLGIMQTLTRKIGWMLSLTVGTTAAESMNAAGNIFVGQTEAPLLIAPFIKDLTKSEMHSVLTGGFATIAGTVMAAYISFGVDPGHLITASIMSAPAALAYSKLFYPETEKSKTKFENIKMDKGDSSNLLEAATKGASNSIGLVANIAANLIAFLAFINFMNVTVAWFFLQVNVEGFDLKYLLSKIFYPLAFVMGVEAKDCNTVARLIGIKTIANEFIAYKELGDLIEDNAISKRSQVIATYALCGFSNLSSIGIQIGGLGAIAPERKSDLAEVAVRALISGSIACFLTACIAGLLTDVPDVIDPILNGTETTTLFSTTLI